MPLRRYALARPGAARREEGVRRLRLVRMEAIADQERARERAEERAKRRP
jgi:hypothetical protein